MGDKQPSTNGIWLIIIIFIIIIIIILKDIYF